MTPEEEEARGQLLFHLENQTGFWFAVVAGDDARPRARVREAAEAWCEAHGVSFWLHAPPPHKLIQLAAELARGASAGLHWIRTDGPEGLIDQWEVATSQLLLAMNERREAYRKRLDGGVVLEGRASLKRNLRELSPDLFTIRAFIAEPGTHVGGVSAVPEWRAPLGSMVALLAVGADPDRELERAERLRGVEGQGARYAWLEAMHAAISGLASTGRFEEMERWGSDVIERIDQWSQEDPEDGPLVTARALVRWTQGITALQRSRYEDALRWLDEAIVFFEARLDGAQGVEQVFSVLMLRDLLGLKGDVLLRRGDLAEAEPLLLRRLKIAEALAQENASHQEWQLDLIAARQELAGLLRRRGDPAAAERMLREIVTLVEQCAAAHPTEDRWQLELLSIRRTLGEALAARGDLAAALEAYRAALGAAEGLAEREAGARWQVEIWELHASLWEVSVAQGDIAAVLAAAEQMLSVAERLRGQSPGDARAGWLIASSQALRAMFLQEQGDIERAGEALLLAWHWARNLPLGRVDAEWVTAIIIASVHLVVGHALFAVIDSNSVTSMRAALQPIAGLFKRAVRLCERCLEENPDRAGARSLLDRAYRFLATLRRLQGKHRQARRLRHKRRVLRRHRRG